MVYAWAYASIFYLVRNGTKTSRPGFKPLTPCLVHICSLRGQRLKVSAVQGHSFPWDVPKVLLLKMAWAWHAHSHRRMPQAPVRPQGNILTTHEPLCSSKISKQITVGKVKCQACLLYCWVVWKLWVQYDACTILRIHLLYFCQVFVVTCKRSLCQKECSEILIPSVKEVQRKAGRRNQMCSQGRKMCPAHCICISVTQHSERRGLAPHHQADTAALAKP